ncbi:MAG: PQQ-binding-like beta-propeller repeat protein [Labilithrix sp.]|nr:PQQ-binding-like beta-propeller repeat protein [Labilithrix sp.]MCW5816415.1 PQQ-binding-like beta-propeller repeat protein [Labilithrix sp.]
MSLPMIACAAGEPVLLTIDGKDLLAFDATTGAAKWRLSFERRLAGVAFAALERGATSPWRAPASASEAVVVDASGTLHAVDAAAGRVVGSREASGAPSALAGSGDVVAVAFDRRVIVWSEGATHEIAIRAVALAVARDGRTLAIATNEGDLVLVDPATGATTARHALCVDVNGVTASPEGWIVACDEGLRAVTPDGTTRRLLDGPVERTALDVASRYLAVHRSDTSVVVYDWPPAGAPAARVTLGKGHHLVDVAFGEENLLAVGIDRGDASLVDLAAFTSRRTEAHPGRAPHDWLLTVEDETQRASRAEAQRKTSAGAGAPASVTNHKARLAIGATIGFGVLLFRLFSLQSPASTFYEPPPFPHLEPHCDEACARVRLSVLEATCRDEPALGCSRAAEEAQAAFGRGRCEEVTRALDEAEDASAHADGGATEIFSATLRLAREGAKTGCKDQPAEVEVVQLRGPDRSPEPTGLAVSATDRLELWATPSGTLFALTVPPPDAGRTCTLRQRSPVGAWSTRFEERCAAASLHGRSAAEAYVSFDARLYAFDGREWRASAGPSGLVIDQLASTSGPTGELFALDHGGALHRRRDGKWSSLHVARLERLYSGPALFARGATDTAADALLRWSGEAFTVQRVVADRATSVRLDAPIVDVWSSPTGELFAARPTSLGRSKDAGRSWEDWSAPGSMSVVWGRSANDVYAGGTTGLRRFDGATWSTTGYAEPIRALTGNARDLWVAIQRR